MGTVLTVFGLLVLGILMLIYLNGGFEKTKKCTRCGHKEKMYHHFCRVCRGKEFRPR